MQFAPPFNTLTPVTASNLNRASISVGKLAGVETVTRRVKNVGSARATYRAEVAVPGFDVVVTPNRFTLNPGAEQTLTVKFSRTTAALGEWAIGSLTWSDRTHTFRSPVALEPVTVSTADEVHGTGASGSQTFQVTPGFTGALDSTVDGLIGVTPHADSVTTGSFDFTNPVADADTKKYTVTVGPGAKAARFSLDAVDDTSDLDLWVYKDGELFDLSASGAADEQVTVTAPPAGTYDVYVNGFATPGGSTAYGLANFVVTPGTVGNASVTPDPAQATAGQPLTLTASWTGLDTTKRWLGLISYANSEAVTYFSVG